MKKTLAGPRNRRHVRRAEPTQHSSLSLAQTKVATPIFSLLLRRKIEENALTKGLVFTTFQCSLAVKCNTLECGIDTIDTI